MSRDAIRHLQRGLAGLGHDPGPFDGILGRRTDGATLSLARSRGLLRSLPAEDTRPTPDGAFPSPPQSRVEEVFGSPGGHEATAGRCRLPFPFVIAWDDSQRITSFACHRLVADTLTSIFAEAALHYGEDEFRRLRLDLFGGCFNDRNMRGGSRKSMHAWGIAVDLDPVRNQLRWGADRAAFARPEYDPWWRIVETHGAVSLGREVGRDFMHFQFATL